MCLRKISKLARVTVNSSCQIIPWTKRHSVTRHSIELIKNKFPEKFVAIITHSSLYFPLSDIRVDISRECSQSFCLTFICSHVRHTQLLRANPEVKYLRATLCLATPSAASFLPLCSVCVRDRKWQLNLSAFPTSTKAACTTRMT